MKYADAQLVSKESKNTDAQDSHIAAVAQRHGNDGGNPAFIAVCLGFSYCWKQKHSHRVGDGRGKKDKGKGHAGKDSVNRQSLRVRKAGAHQLIGNPDCFCTSKNIEDQAVTHERKGQSHQGSCG